MSGNHLVAGRIASYLPSSLIDYPGHMATVGFMMGCNLRCGFCHNKDLVDAVAPTPYHDKTEEFLKFIEDKKIEYVVLTGGDPLFNQAALNELLIKIKNISVNIKIKLDTNGSMFLGNHEGATLQLNKIVGAFAGLHLINYLAMDIKAFTQKDMQEIAFHNGEATSPNYWDHLTTNIEDLTGTMYDHFTFEREFRHTLYQFPDTSRLSDMFRAGCMTPTQIPLYLQKFNNENTLDLMGNYEPTTADLDLIIGNLSSYFSDIRLRGF